MIHLYMQESVRRLSRFKTNRSICRKFLLGSVVLICMLMLSAFLAAPELVQRQHYSTVVYDNSNQLLGARLSSDGQWRFTPVDQLPERYSICLRRYEDQRFYWHLGIDPIAVVRASFLNIKEGKVISGGSTITMQLARMLCKHRKRGVWNKIVEGWYAVGLELNFSKNKILHLYASFAPYGGNVVGFDAALWRYFQRSHRELSWAEAALLAVLPNQPSWLHLQKNRSLLVDKRNRLLRSLLFEKIIDQEVYTLAIQEPLPEKLHAIPQNAQGLLDDLMMRYPGQHRFYTSIDFRLQSQLMEMVRSHSSILRGNEIHNLSVLVVQNNTGKVICYIPNTPEIGFPVENQQVNNIRSLRSSGSILKPLLFASAMEKNLIHPGILLPDIPTTYGNFTPENFSKSYYGVVSARNALQQSLNIPAVRILKEYGLTAFYDKLRSLGFSSFKKPAEYYGLSLILGGGEVSAWELAKVYSHLAFQLNQYHEIADRRKWKQRKDLSLLKADEPSLYFNDSKGPFQIPAIYQMFDLMKGSPMQWNEIPVHHTNMAGQISWKTGTSFGFKDAWCVGVSPELTVVVWVGNSNGLGRPGLIGVHTAAPLLFDLAAQLKMKSEWIPPTDLMYPNIVCRQSGMEKSMYCLETDTIWTGSSATAFGLCGFHKLFYLDPAKQYRVTKDCDINAQAEIFFALSPVMEYFYKQHQWSFKAPPPWRPDCQYWDAGKGSEFEIIYPVQGSSIYLPVDLDLLKNNIVLKATHKDPKASLFWFLDGHFIGTTISRHELQTNLKMGQHRLTIGDEKGNSTSITFKSRHSTR